MSWFTDGIKVNPTSGAQLAITSAILGPRSVTLKVFITGTVQVTVVVQQIDSTPAVVKSHILVQAAGSGEFDPGENSIQVTDAVGGETFKVITNGTVVGQVQASIFVDA